jgi:uncharacterized alkaline shock family protein YloU
MNKRSGRLGDFFMTLLLLGIGAGLIYGSAYDVEVGEQIAEALKIPMFGICVGSVLILSVVLRWVGGLGKPKDTFINFESDEGNVGISANAVCDFVERIGKEFAAVESIDSKLIKHKNSLDIALDVKVRSGNKIPELSQVLQQRVRESVRESLGLESIGNIAIKVKEIIGDPERHDDEPPAE